MSNNFSLTARGHKAEVVMFKHLCFSIDERFKFSRVIPPPVKFTSSWCKNNWGSPANPKVLSYEMKFLNDEASLEVLFSCDANHLQPIVDGLRVRFPSVSFTLNGV